MKKRLALLLGMLALLLLTSARADENAYPVCRALLIGCDEFVTMDDIAPAARINVERLREVLLEDDRAYERMTVRDEGLGSLEALEEAVKEAFYGAQTGDISLIYFCTHGLYDRLTYTPSLVLSDGQTEELLSAEMLYTLLKDIQGEKILILDACNSGAFIGKGAWDEKLKNAFQSPDFYVLTSAGALENSFLWRENDRMNGGSYFTQEMCDGLQSREYDLDADGIVTLQEACRGLRMSHGASTAQIYPEESDYALYRYQEQESGEKTNVLQDMTLENSVLTEENNEIYFSYTLLRPVKIKYQLVYYRGGTWLFDAPQVIEDAENETGAVQPGRKERTICLTGTDVEDSGYVLLQIIACEEQHSQPVCTRVLSVQPLSGNPKLSISTMEGFSLTENEELGILVQYDFPCSLTLIVRDLNGSVIRRMAYKQESRPMGFLPDGSTFYWNGKTNAGEDALPGVYVIEASCKIGGETYSVLSDYIMLQ